MATAALVRELREPLRPVLILGQRGRSFGRVWVARSLRGRPLTVGVARLEPIGVPGVSSGADARAIYVAHLRVPSAGRYLVVARPLGGTERIAALGDLVVHRRSTSPPVGARAYPSHTPTLASTPCVASPEATPIPASMPT